MQVKKETLQKIKSDLIKGHIEGDSKKIDEVIKKIDELIKKNRHHPVS